MKQRRSFLRGYSMVVHSFLMYWIYGTLIGGGLSVIVTQYCGMTGLDASAVTSVNTAGGFLSVVMTFFIGRWVMKHGVRAITAFSCVGTAIGLCILGNGRTLGVYILWSAISQGLYNGYSFTATNALIANWFPRKKDLVLGYVTMGSNLSTALCLYIIGFLLAKVSLTGTFLVWGVIYLVLGVLSFALLRDNPEELGEFPDNDRSLTQEQVQEQFRQGEEYRKNGGLTTGDILKKRQSWQIAFGYGIILLITVGILSTLVSTLIIKGLPEMNAISIMTIAAVLGIPFSYLWGYLGVKFSTKKATMLLYAVIFVMIAVMLIPGTWTAYVTAVLLGCFIGAGNNLTPAIIATVFGRYDFSKALAVIMPIWNIVVAFATTVVGVPQSLTGSYVAAYIVLAVVAVIGFILVVTLDDRCIGREDA